MYVELPGYRIGNKGQDIVTRVQKGMLVVQSSHQKAGSTILRSSQNNTMHRTLVPSTQEVLRGQSRVLGFSLSLPHTKHKNTKKEKKKKNKKNFKLIVLSPQCKEWTGELFL